MAEHTFTWPQGPNDVIITGDFDKWSGSLPLVKSPRGDFALTVPIEQTSSDKFHFKFIVDGQWQTSNEYKTETSPEGISNNYLVVSSLSSLVPKSSSATGAKIPEIGLNLVAPEVAAPVLGTQAPPKAQPAPRSNKKSKKKKIQIKRRIRRNKKTGERTVLSEERSELKSGTDSETYETEETATATATSREETPVSLELDPAVTKAQHQNGFQSTVMPSTENKQTTLGEPGIAIIPNAGEIKEFSEVRDVDGDELNERLNREMAEKKAAKNKASETAADLKHPVVEKDMVIPGGELTDPQFTQGDEPDFPIKEKDLSAPGFPVVAKEETEGSAAPIGTSDSLDNGIVRADVVPEVVPVPEVTQTEQLAVEEPIAKELAVEEPIAKELSVEEPITKELAVEEPITEELAVEEPLTEEPAGKELPTGTTGLAAAAAAAVAADAAAELENNEDVPTDEGVLPSKDVEVEPHEPTAAVQEQETPVDSQFDSLPVVEKVSPLKEAGLSLEGGDSSMQAVKGLDTPQSMQVADAKKSDVVPPALSENDGVAPPIESSLPTDSFAAEPVNDVDIVVVEGTLDELPPKKSTTTEPSTLPDVSASNEEPLGEIEGIPKPSDLVSKESGDALDNGTEKAAPVVSEEIGVITSPEQEAELIRKTLDPKASHPGETEELLIVEGDIPPSQIKEYQDASDAAAAEAIAHQEPEEVVAEQDEVAKDTVKPKKESPPQQKTGPASPEKKKKKKGLFSKIKKIFH
ncbi:LADA_0E03224g1_1 [Lachancea dasiensis]|uniref:LADA_0E03224g1_1 n=1 Tax=Lachancea dasiensis TaxID=1072105 RepID=A0A1G4JBR8_9SACH|nr:LADA_0E03224g1_1 [Lachancea dasiensis]